MQHRYCPYCMTAVEPGQLCGGCGQDPASYRAEPHHIPLGTLLRGRFYVGKSLGEGGFGITYLGLDTLLGRKVAIKEYFPRTMVRRDSSVSLRVTCYAGSSPHFSKGVEQFLKEAQTLAQLEDIPQIVRVIDCFSENDTAYIIMEYLDGITLANYGIRPPSEIIGLLKPVLKAMDSMHQGGVIHRDISPDNLMLLKKNGQIKLMDFGCARELSGGSTMTITLKPGFAPPEQYTGHEQGPWTDVYGICATIYYCITGKLPPEATRRLMQDELVPPSELCTGLSPAQEQALLKGLAINVADRWHSTAELYRALYEEQPVAVPVSQGAAISPTAFVPASVHPGPSGGKAPVSGGAAVANTEFVDVSAHQEKKTRRENKKTHVSQSADPQPKKKKGGLVAAILLVLIVGGLGAFWFLHPHQYREWTVTKDPTCIELGLRERKCFCGETQQETLDYVGHTAEIDAAVPATCKNTGLTEGSHCAVCDVVLTAQEVTPLTDHDIITLQPVAPTCTETGLTAGSGCSVCGYIESHQQTVEALGHNPVDDPAVAATCKSNGKTEGSHCDNCGMVIVKQESTPKADHTPSVIPAVAATCQSTGKTEGSRCAVCLIVLEEPETLPKTDHSPVTDPAVAATCKSVGKTEGSHCSVCGLVIKEQQTIEKTSHTPVTDPAVPATCYSTGKTEGSHCSVCGTVLKAQETVAKTAHTPVTDPAVPATCTSEGLSEGSHCSVCGEILKEQTVTSGPIGHDIRQSGYCNNCGAAQWSMTLSISPNFGTIGEDGSILVTISYQLHGLDPSFTGSFTYRQTQTGQSTQTGSIGCTRDGDSGSFTVRLYNWENTTLAFSVYSDFGWEIASKTYSF